MPTLLRPATLAKAALFLASLLPLAHARSAEPELLVQIKAHRFEPAALKAPANTRLKLVIHNLDATPEEFESHALNREKLIPAGAKASVYVGPLKPGRYAFFGEFNPDSAQGTLIVE